MLLLPTTWSFGSLAGRSVPWLRWYGTGVPRGLFAVSAGIAGAVRIAPLVAFALFYAVRPAEGRSVYWLLPALFVANAVADVVVTGGLLSEAPRGAAFALGTPRLIQSLVYGAMAVWLWTARPTVGESV